MVFSDGGSNWQVTLLGSLLVFFWNDSKEGRPTLIKRWCNTVTWGMEYFRLGLPICRKTLGWAQHGLHDWQDLVVFSLGSMPWKKLLHSGGYSQQEVKWSRRRLPTGSPTGWYPPHLFTVEEWGWYVRPERDSRGDHPGICEPEPELSPGIWMPVRMYVLSWPVTPAKICLWEIPHNILNILVANLGLLIIF